MVNSLHTNFMFDEGSNKEAEWILYFQRSTRMLNSMHPKRIISVFMSIDMIETVSFILFFWEQQ